VHFIGDPSHAEVAISKIEKFEKKYEEFSKTKKRSLLNSITLAKKIVKGEITFNNHLKEKENIIKKKPKVKFYFKIAFFRLRKKNKMIMSQKTKKIQVTKKKSY
jgi:hypothetical protein